MKCFLFSILFGLFVNINSSFSQCKDFALTNCKPKLAGYAYNGNYTSFLLKEEEKVELHKAFFSGQKYRVVVGCQDSLPRVHFCIVDLDKNLIFDNKGSDYADYFDFELDEAMNLIIVLEIAADENQRWRQESACVSILFGMEL